MTEDENIEVQWARKELEMNQLADALAPVAFFVVVAFIIKGYLDYRLRKTLIDKGMVDEKTKYLNLVNGSGGRSSLKWGLILTLVGLVMIVVKAMPFYVEDEIVLGAMFIAAGGGLLVFYIVDDIYRKRQQRELPKV